MTENIFNFLTGGTSSTLKQVIQNIIEWIITFITNTTFKFFEPIINVIYSIIPVFEDIGTKINFVFNLITPYIGFILDASFISKPILVYLIFSIIFRITIKHNTYVVKLILNWYERLKP